MHIFARRKKNNFVYVAITYLAKVANFGKFANYQ